MLFGDNPISIRDVIVSRNHAVREALIKNAEAQTRRDRKELTKHYRTHYLGSDFFLSPTSASLRLCVKIKITLLGYGSA